MFDWVLLRKSEDLANLSLLEVKCVPANPLAPAPAEADSVKHLRLDKLELSLVLSRFGKCFRPLYVSAIPPLLLPFMAELVFFFWKFRLSLGEEVCR